MRRFSAPDNEAPAAVPTSTVLRRGPDAAVLLTSELAYSTGTEFMLSIGCGDKQAAAASRCITSCVDSASTRSTPTKRFCSACSTPTDRGR